MGRYLSIIILLSLILMPYVGGIGTHTGSITSDVDFIVSNVVDFERGPTVNLVTNNSATIFWRTDTLTDATINYGVNTSILESASNSTLDTDHLITLNGLEMDTKYYYKVSSGGDESETYYFYTAPADGEEFRLVIAGDNRPDSTVHPVQPEVFSEIADLIIAENPHMVILLGDFVYQITSSDAANLAAWKLFTDITDRMGHYAPVIGVIGNHDTGVSSGVYLTKYFLDAFINTGEHTTYFSFDYAGIHFTALDTEEEDLEGRITGTQLDWFTQDLNENEGKMKFVLAHRPLYSTTHIGSSLDVNPEEQAALIALLEEKNVTLFAAGHDHSYSRLTVNGVVHLISGGLGAPSYSSSWGDDIFHYVMTTVSENSVNFTVINSDGYLHDQYILPYDGPIEIVDRIIANTSSKPIGTVPVILFSEVPTTKYYSWDGVANTTEITGLPGPEGAHTLDVYAENEDGVWSSARFVFTTIVPDTGGSTTQTPPPDGGLDIMLVVGITGIVAVIVVVGIIFKTKKR
ncbi:MAG: metallophosphoesterase family protein [Candidatus Thorarchaeota archaeon]|nr:metallophosphoesterase family protein [Candidatus Thorarchaeota archaeon]